MADGFVPIFKPAGVGSRAGAVPDPGAATPADYVLRADATWGPAKAGSENEQHSLATLTIAAGQVESNAPVVFAPPFTLPPQVWLTGDRMETLLFVTGVTLGGCTVHAAAAVAVVADLTVNLNVLAITG